MNCAIEKLEARRAVIAAKKAAVEKSKVLLVGAGGIGCELLKNLVLSGFQKIDVFDLDTIEVSNLNRQFLFQRPHVGQPKCVIAKESVLKFNPNCDITTYHESIISDKFGVNFFKEYDLVLNALDNRAARNHVNRMCLAADIPLIESGSAGFFGQVYVIKKGVSECYECIAKPSKEKSYPSCTVRNTPSEPIHCIVWGKNLFHQLFGEQDADNEVSPDTADPELMDQNENSAEPQPQPDGSDTDKMETDAKDEKERVSTRDWAESCDYDPYKLLKKFFIDDIKYLLTMENLWKKRKAPIPLTLEDISSLKLDDTKLKDNEIWSLKTWVCKFAESVEALKKRRSQCTDEKKILSWDKDDDVAMDFTGSAANIRSQIFHIAQQSRFTIKSMAGNIIPAIATTNAIVAGLIVIEAEKALLSEWDKCKSVFLKRQPQGRKGTLFTTSALYKPNPNCYVCSAQPEVTLKVNTATFLVRSLEEKVLKKQLSMVLPDVEVQDGKGTIVLSSEPDETSGNLDKPLANFGIKDGSRLKADDFFQNFAVVVTIEHVDQLSPELKPEEQEFLVVGEAKPAEKTETDSKSDAPAGDKGDAASLENGSKAGNEQVVVNLDDENEESELQVEVSLSVEPAAKKVKLDATHASVDIGKASPAPVENSDDELVCLE